MRVVQDLPHPVEEIENIWIPLPDGVRLAARMWLPERAGAEPVPAVLEYIPYRKRDLMRLRDEPIHRYFAGHGYASLRVDLRGAGDSDGILIDEYSALEIEDAAHVIAWIAAQPWCDGRVGMMGISWGGFNSIQVAAQRPPALRAVITLCAADDRYADDAHYMGGCLLNENLQWGAMFWHLNAYPPDPDIVGEDWRDRWRERLQSATFFPAVWLAHQRRDDYWRHGSVCEDYRAIECPVYAIGGWADGYSNAVPRLISGLRSPRKGLIGPWAHTFPHDGKPGPAIGFLQEAVRWWDHWLKDIDTGIADEPLYRVWMQESVRPQPSYEERPGRWVAEASWPSRRIRSQRWYLNTGTLGPEPDPGDGTELAWLSPQTTGLGGGNWCGFGGEGELPIDQRVDDGKSLVFDSDPLAEEVEVLGGPIVTLELALDRPTGFVAVRLSDVASDGAVTRVTYGLLNLTHRHGHDRVDTLEPGKRYRVPVRLNDIAHVFPAGNRVRIAVSTSYWPIVWPSPEATTLTLLPGAGTLDLPVRPTDPSDAKLRPFRPPERAPRGARTKLFPMEFRRTYERDLARHETVYTLFSDAGELGGAAMARIEEIDLDVGHSVWQQYRINDDDPLSASMEVRQNTVLQRGDWSVNIRSRARLTADFEVFHLAAELEATENGVAIFRQTWKEEIPRDGI